jgi:hypothetical protein
MTDNRTCGTCIWLSTGFGDDVRGSGWCYSNQDYRDNDDSCPFWLLSLRNEPLEDAPVKEVEG